MIVTIDQVIVFSMIFARILGVFTLAPFFSNRQIITMAKVAFAIWLAFSLIFVVPLPIEPYDSNVIYILRLISEFLFGVLIGFVSDLLVTSIQFAGSIIDAQAGLSVAAMLDPSSGNNAALFEQMLNWVALMIFLLMDGHHMILSSLFQSFSLFPVGIDLNLAAGARYVVTLVTEIFLIAAKLSAPIVLVVFIVDFAFGLLNRVAEQINVFQLGFQLKPIVSLIIFLAITPGMIGVLASIMEGLMMRLLELMSVMQLS